MTSSRQSTVCPSYRMQFASSNFDPETRRIQVNASSNDERAENLGRASIWSNAFFQDTIRRRRQEFVSERTRRSDHAGGLVNILGGSSSPPNKNSIAITTQFSLK